MAFSKAETYLMHADAVLGNVIAANGSITRQQRTDYFASLAGSIIGQQISVKAAAKILERFNAATGMEPERVSHLQETDVKMIGLSGQKSRYLYDLSEHFIQDSAVFDHLDTLNDNEVIAELTRVKGVGIWTAQMFLMFTLVRPDVFAPGDRGLQLAIQKLYKLTVVPDEKELSHIAEKWAPYRTTACWHLWHSLDNEPV